MSIFSERFASKKPPYDLILIYGVILACILLLFWNFTAQNRQRILASNRIYAEDITRQTADRISDQFESALTLIKTCSFFLEQSGKPLNTKFSLLKRLQENSPFDRLGFADASGLFFSGSGGVANVEKEEFYKKGMAGETGISIQPYSHVYQQPVLVFFAPLRADGKVVGVLQGVYLAEKNLRSLLQGNFFGVQSYLYLCLPNGWIIANSAGKRYPERIFHTLENEGFLNAQDAREAQRLLAGSGGALSPENNSASSSIVAAPVLLQRFFLVEIFPAAVAQAMTREANRSWIELEICILLLFALHTLLLLWRYLNQKRKLILKGREKEQVVAATNSLFAARYALCDLQNATYRYIVGSRPADPNLPLSGTYQEMLNYQVAMLVNGADKESFRKELELENLRNHLASSDFEVYECRVNRNGKEGWDNLNAICIERDAAGIPVKVIFMRQNMTETKAKQLNLERKISIMDRQERQYRLAVTSKSLFAYEFNVSRDQIDNDIAIAWHGSSRSLLSELGLSAPCKASDFFHALMERVQHDSREDFSVLLNMDYLVKRYEAGHKQYDLEVWQTLADENEICIRLSFYMTRDDRSGDVMALVVARDITDHVLRQRQQTKALRDALLQARHANEAKTTFLSNMSHDIRTPMNAIIGFSTIALTHLENTGQVRDCLTKVLSSSNHLLSLINDILDMSRIESGKIQIKLQDCKISELMHNLITIIQPQVKAKQLQMFIDTFEVVNEDVLADPLKLNQIFINLLGNAVKYTPAGGSIAFRIRQTPAFRHGYADYVFEISDNGIGMSPEFVKHIFEPFTRESTTTQSGIQGTGLGMAITKNIIDMLNGTIEVESEPGKGTRFTVRLTLQLLDHKTEETDLEELRGIRVLVVDDDVNVCDSVDKMLRKIGLRSEWTSSGREAVQRVKIAHNDGDPFNTIILDWHMPDQSGVETARQIRRIVGEDTPIIILTAYDWAEIEQEAREAGVSAFCAKPLFMSDLRNALLTSHRLKDVEEKEIEERHDFGQRRILLVDDLEMNREVAEFILAESGFLVEMAPDGTDAVEMVLKSPEGYYDAILMDVQMPIMNGYEATRTIRSMNRQDVKTMPIIAMTANALEEDKAAALKYGMNAHIAKPIDIKNFFAILKDLLAAGSQESQAVSPPTDKVA